MKSHEESGRFNLRRYFSVFSIIIILVLTAVLSYLVLWNQKHVMINYSISSIEIFAHQLNQHIYNNFIVQNLKEYGELTIEKNSFYHEKLDSIADHFLSDHSDVIKFKIYDTGGNTIYSTEPDDMGIISTSSILKLALNGDTSSVLTRRASPIKEDTSEKGKAYNIDILELYIPLYTDVDKPSVNEIVGVLELYKNISPLINLIRDNFYKIPLILILSMGTLYLSLQIVIRKADTIIKRKNKEIDSHNRELEEAQKRITGSIDDVIKHGSFYVRYNSEDNGLLKCWEFKNCNKTDCPSYKSEYLRCWQIAGTFCGGQAQGVFAQKYGDCRKCGVYRHAFRDRISVIGESFNNMMTLLQNEHLELERLNEKLNILVDIDPLTQIENRRSFQKKIEHNHKLGLRYNRSYSLILCDVDNFKAYNDFYGHQMGDHVLITVANVMKTMLRGTDEIFRWGGEEFVVILPEQNLSDTLKIAENLRSGIEILGIEHKRNDPPIVTVSCGVASNLSLGIKDIFSWESVLKRSDDALYKAKLAGRNCVYSSTDTDYKL